MAVTMIPTGYKSKIASTLSYPLGAKAISEALEGVPQTGSLTVEFRLWDRGRWTFGSTPPPYRVLSVGYCHTRLNAVYRTICVESGPLDAGWIIIVEPVPRSFRYAVRSMLLTEALPRMKRWLIASQDTEGRSGGHNLVFRFDKLANELKVEENSTIEWNTTRAD